MSQSNVKVSTEALSGLNDKLMNLAGCLHSIYEFMVNNMKKIGEDAWQDHKYQEFVDGYSPQILKCDNIADRYEKWCKDAITPLLGKVEKVDSASVTLDGVGSSSGGGGAAAGATAGAAAAAGASAKNSKTSRFNTGKKTSVAQKSSTDKKNPAVTTSPSAKSEKKKFETDGALEEADNLCRHLEGNEHSQAISAKDPNAKNVKMMEFNVSNVGGEWNAGGEVNAKAAKVIKNVVDIEGKVQADYHSGKKSSNVTFKVPFDCSTPENDN